VGFDQIKHQDQICREAVDKNDVAAMQRCVDQAEWLVLEKELEAEGIITGPHIYSEARCGHVRLGSIIVKKSQRGQGKGLTQLTPNLHKVDHPVTFKQEISCYSQPK